MPPFGQKNFFDIGKKLENLVPPLCEHLWPAKICPPPLYEILNTPLQIQYKCIVDRYTTWIVLFFWLEYSVKYKYPADVVWQTYCIAAYKFHGAFLYWSNLLMIRPAESKVGARYTVNLLSQSQFVLFTK